VTNARADSPKAARRTPRGPTDPDRPQRIADAAWEVIARDGIEALSHRSVAAQAGVPLGSTTYHFKTLDDILVAAIEKAIPETRAEIETWAEGLGDNPDLAVALAELAVRWVDEHEQRTIVEYQLTIAALRRPVLQPLALEWSGVLAQTLERFVDPHSAWALTAVHEGTVMRAMASGRRLDRGEMEEVFRRVVTT